jgi:AbrB family looped-hinge helix DNA binding protein
MELQQSTSAFIPTSVTQKGQVTIPQSVRSRFGIRAGSKIAFTPVGDHIEMRVVDAPKPVVKSAFGLLRSKQKSVPVDFDVATLFAKQAG